ncbi:hypothetical protein SAY87_016684 [Trapa incisa]|uniref:Sphingomyelin synthase-like domain-containing protein n=1 Tax=Trapa incisa TaxID=236973 RepID=A0AAN7LCW3_9MYRT|nr:hypothetical protein SAY87_016684 [Trapa incisa]
MPVYVAREAPKLWRKICSELSVEIALLSENWKHLLAGIVFQYIHGVAAHGVHYLHLPGPTLQDIGFLLVPELGQERAYASESLFAVIFCSFFLWTFHPFVLQNKRIYTVLIWCRVLAYLVACQILRILTFYSTQLPGPNYHCRKGSRHATLAPPDSALEVLLLNFPRGILYGCGDLIFSSHMIFCLAFIRTYHKYGVSRIIKLFAWLLAVAQSLLIIACRKHYTVDIIVAWYTVNLVAFFIDSKLPELPDRSSASLSSSLLPSSAKEKDGKNKEERFSLLNGIILST